MKSEKIENFEDFKKKKNQVNENSDKGRELEVKYKQEFEIIENYVINFEENNNNNKLDVNKIDNEYDEWNFVETYTYI